MEARAAKTAKAAKSKARRSRTQSGGELVGQRVSIRWTGDTGQPWYSGKLVEFNASTNEHLVLYDDGEQKMHELAVEEEAKQLRWL